MPQQPLFFGTITALAKCLATLVNLSSIFNFSKAHTACKTTVPFCWLMVVFGNTISCRNSTVSKMVSCLNLSLLLGFKSGPSCFKLYAQELTSITTGICPELVALQRVSTMALAVC